MKAWMGFGISKYYEELSRNINQFISRKDFDELVFLVADEMHRKYNGSLNQKILLNIKRNLKDLEAKVISSKELEENIPLESMKHKYKHNEDFRSDVNFVVSKNVREPKNIDLLAGYVLEELALIIYFEKKNFVKLGVSSKEKPFDLLAQKYFDLDKKSFVYI